MGGDPIVNKPILILPNNQQSHKYGVYTDIFCWLGANFANLSWLPCFCLGYRAKWLRLQGWRYFTLNNVMNKRASPATYLKAPYLKSGTLANTSSQGKTPDCRQLSPLGCAFGDTIFAGAQKQQSRNHFSATAALARWCGTPLHYSTKLSYTPAANTAMMIITCGDRIRKNIVIGYTVA